MTESKLVAIDPGINGVGIALFDGSVLVGAGYVKGTLPRSADVLARAVALGRACGIWVRVFWPDGADHVVSELPQIYRVGRGKGDPNDLLGLAAVDGAVSLAVGGEWVESVRPRAWKSNIDPDVMIERIKSRLSSSETAKVVLSAKSLDHNIYDAIGVGLASLGRLTPRRMVIR